MDRILMILKKKLTPGVSLTLPWGYIHVYEHYRFIGIYLRSQVSVYRTTGPMVIFASFHVVFPCVLFFAFIIFQLTDIQEQTSVYFCFCYL